jgi:hypothetical protein
VDFRRREVNFQEADRRYAELKRQLDAGTISTEEFDAQRQQLMVQDDEGRWWAKSRESGDWHYHDGEGWVRSTPPGYQSPPAGDALDHWSRLEQTESFSSRSQVRDERSPLSQPEQNEQLPPQTTSLDSSPTRDRNRGMAQTHAAPVIPSPPTAREDDERRRRRPWVPILLLLLLLLLALLGWVTYALTRGTNEDVAAPNPLPKQTPVPPNVDNKVEKPRPESPPPPNVDNKVEKPKPESPPPPVDDKDGKDKGDSSKVKENG